MKLGLVLSGGGANGAFAAGVVEAVERAGLQPAVLSGTSAGAITAAGLAAGFTGEQVAALWTEVDTADVYRLRRDVHRLLRPGGLFAGGNVAERALETVGWTWLLDTEPLRRTLTRLLGSSRIGAPADKAVALSAVEMATGELVHFVNQPPAPHRRTERHRVVDLSVDHLMGSAAIPLVFREAEVEGVWYWDGGLVANTPLAPALAYEPDAVIVVTSATRERPAPRPASLAQAISLLIDNVLGHSLRSDLEHAQTVNRLCELVPDLTDRRKVDFLIVEPTGHDLGNALDFSPALAERRLDLGRRLGAEALRGWLP